ncbi:MAG: hypothetical protein ACREB2_06685 [Pseudolabrys sp.]
MKHVYKAFYGALLVLGLASVTPVPALADGYHWDANCNCRRPDSGYTTRRYVREAPVVRNRERYVDHTRVVRGETRLVQENRVIVHVRPVINREIVVHRTNTIVKDLLLHRVNVVNRLHEEYRHEVVNRYEQGWVRHVLERREARPCGCGSERGLFEHSSYQTQED